MSVAARLPGIVLLLLVLLATGLILVGYGPPVAVGVLAGLLLGFAVVIGVLAVANRPGSRSGSQVSIFRDLDRGGRSERGRFEAIQRHAHEMMRVAGVDAGALRRVVPVGQTVTAGDVPVELTWLELRTDGGIVPVPPPRGGQGARTWKFWLVQLVSPGCWMSPGTEQ